MEIKQNGKSWNKYSRFGKFCFFFGKNRIFFFKKKEKLRISSKVMKNGIIFIWSEKHLIWEICKLMIKKGFGYIENFTIIYLSKTKCLEI